MSLPSDIVDAVFSEIVSYCKCTESGGECKLGIARRPRLEQAIEEMIVLREIDEAFK